MAYQWGEMTVWHYSGSVSFIRSHIGLLTPAAQDRRVKGCWQVLIAKKDCRQQGMILYFHSSVFCSLLSWYFARLRIIFVLFLHLHQNGRNEVGLCHKGLFCSLSALHSIFFLFTQVLQWSTQINVFIQKIILFSVALSLLTLWKEFHSFLSHVLLWALVFSFTCTLQGRKTVYWSISVTPELILTECEKEVAVELFCENIGFLPKNIYFCLR